MNWLTCSVDKWKDHTNDPVNLEQCFRVRRYESIGDRPAIMFESGNGNETWLYDTEAEREADYQRLLNVIKDEITLSVNAEPVEPKSFGELLKPGMSFDEIREAVKKSIGKESFPAPLPAGDSLEAFIKNKTLGVWDKGFINVPRYSANVTGGMQIVAQGHYVEAKTMHLITGALMDMVIDLAQDNFLGDRSQVLPWIGEQLQEKGLIS